MVKFDNRSNEKTFSFNYHNDEDGTYISYSFSIAPDGSMTWDEDVVPKFIDFLSSVYGYDLREHISVDDFEKRAKKFSDKRKSATYGDEFDEQG